MEGNPYSAIAEMLLKQNGEQMLMYRGRVTGLSPLTLDIAGISASGRDVMLNADVGFEAGDSVLALTADNQLFYILCRVVSA